MLPFITVDYDEDEPSDYRGVVLKVGSQEVKRENSKGFIEDYNTLVRFARRQYPDLPIMESSSVGHYIMDARIPVEFVEEEA